MRASNTQPVLVMRFDASTPELVRLYRGEMETVVQRAKEAAAKTGKRRGLLYASS